MKLAGFVLALFLCAVVNAADRPNIVLVMADDQGWGDMAYNGHPKLKTPHFDKAAATGLRFDRFYAAAPVCSPTRASVLTGRHPNRMGVFKWGHPMRPQETTIAEALKTAGYATAHFGKWHLGSVRNNSPANPGNNGFDEWLSAPNFYDNDAIMSHRGKAVPIKGESSAIAVDAAIDWMSKKVSDDEPFLAVVWFGSPHLPHQAIENDRNLYPNEKKKLQNFYGEITGMDRAFGKLRQSLTDLKIRDNTIFWYCSDNGALPRGGSTGGFRGHKAKVYEGGLLVPSILEWPARIKSPRVTNTRCNTSDIYPTLLELVGVKVDKQTPLDGISLVSVIDGQEQQRSRPMGFWDYTMKGIGTPSEALMAELFAAQQAGGDLPAANVSINAARLPSPSYSLNEFPGHSAWIDGDWKLHRIANKKNTGKKNADKEITVKWELYDLKNDPYETNNLSSSESQRMEQLKKPFVNWLQSVVHSLNGEDYSS